MYDFTDNDQILEDNMRVLIGKLSCKQYLKVVMTGLTKKLYQHQGGKNSIYEHIELELKNRSLNYRDKVYLR